MESEEGEEGEWRVRRDREGGGGGWLEGEESGEKKYIDRVHVCWCILILRCTSKRHTHQQILLVCTRKYLSQWKKRESISGWSSAHPIGCRGESRGAAGILV